MVKSSPKKVRQTAKAPVSLPLVKRRSALEVRRRHETYVEAAYVLGQLEAHAYFSRRTTAQLLHLRYRQVAWAELQAMVKIIRALKAYAQNCKSSGPEAGIPAGTAQPHSD